MTFLVTWGAVHGADPRRLLALVCRRGSIQGSDVGSIRVEDRKAYVEVARDVADTFEVEARRPDPRAHRVRIERMPAGPPASSHGAQRPARRPPSAHATAEARGGQRPPRRPSPRRG